MGMEFGAQLDKKHQNEFVQFHRELTANYKAAVVVTEACSESGF